MPADQIADRIDHDEGSYTFFVNMVTFLDDIKKADIFLKANKQKSKHLEDYKNNQNGQRNEAPTAAMIKKRLVANEGDSGMTLQKLDRKASVFNKK